MQGLLLLNKPAGKTSFGAVAAVKRLIGEKRAGHTGTLDPMATGVLPIFLGRATALSSYLLDADKSYTAEIQLGITTDTDDITGNVLSQKDFSFVSESLLLSVIEKFIGNIKQAPPIYSAIKKDGVRLYSLAREGKTADIPEREVCVYAINLISFDPKCGKFCIDVTVSKGTYIRSLARDMGEALGCGATLSDLCRTSTSGFDISQCVSLDMLTAENIGQFLLNEETAVLRLPAVHITQKQAVRFCNGGQLGFERLSRSDFEDGQLLRVKYGDVFLGLGYADSRKREVAIRCIINDIRV